MLSDEEKAVLKTAKENYGLTSAEQKILVNLIEKQSKEIEELKEDSCCMTNCVRRDKEKLFLEDKIKAKIEDILNSENSEAIQKLIEWQSLLEKEYIYEKIY